MRHNSILFLVVAILIATFSCKKADDNSGFSDDIKNFVPDSTIQAIRDMGMEINEGKNPPDIEGYYFAQPLVMLESTVPNETYTSESTWFDYLYYFYNQDNENLTVDIEENGYNSNSEQVTHSVGEGTFLSGNGNVFSSFTIQNGYTLLNGNQDTAFSQTLIVISGTMSGSGIENFQEVILMLDDYGDPYNKYIPVNTGRLFIDGDSLAARTTADLKAIKMSSKSDFKDSNNKSLISK
ncbi:hypothetical protein ACE01N_01925 [Saccharicrinis sp. FJH2]|uniref:hypothetical protein n=1 Tax=Saccharicrinis sp. FJH65 TaxID=3344659 RepID=UPI0035F33048